MKVKCYTDLEQSWKLADILPLESADMCYIKGKPKPLIGFLYEEYREFGDTVLQDYYPCWSLAALLNVIKPINGNTYALTGTLDGGALISFEEVTNIMFQEKEIIDAVFKMILKLHELNLL